MEKSTAAGLEVNMRKSFVLWPYRSEPLADVVRMAAQRKLELRRGSARTLGAPIGSDHEFAAKLLKEHFDEQVKLHQLLLDDLIPSQVATLMLRNVVKAKSSYLLRVSDPESNAAINTFNRLDELSVDTLCAKLHVDKSDIKAVALTRIHLPTRLSGSGLQKFSMLAPVAFLAGSTSALSHLAPWRSAAMDDRADWRGADRSEFSAKLERLRVYAVSLGVHDTPSKRKGKDGKWTTKEAQIPASIDAFWSKYSKAGRLPKLQHLWVTAIYKSILSKLLEKKVVGRGVSQHDVDEHERQRAVIRSCCFGTGPRYLNVVPTEDGFVLPDPHFAAAFRLRYSLPRFQSARCHCGIWTKDIQHLMCCKSGHKTGAYVRHQNVLAAVDDGAHKVPMTTSREPKIDFMDEPPSDVYAERPLRPGERVLPVFRPEVDYDSEDDRPPLEDPAGEPAASAADGKEGKRVQKRIRADLRLQAGAECYLLDVTVAHAAAKSYFKRGAERRLYAAGQLARQKDSKFLERVQRMGAKFVPFACESYGALSKEAETFLENLADYKSKDVPALRTPFLRWIRSRVSVAVQHGNASLLFMAGLKNY
jgi:hypothetical protein